MAEERFDEVKDSVLTHIQSLFEEMEEEMAMSHQEKYALLEDSLESASDEAELKVAFEQWYNDHADEVGWDYDVDELWNQAIAGEKSSDEEYEDDDDDIETEDSDKKEDEEEDEDEGGLNDFKNSDEE